MADLLLTPIADNSVKLRWREPYVTDGVDTAMLAHPRGVYRGFWIEHDIPMPSQAFRLCVAATNYAGSDAGHVAGVDLDQFAMYADPTTGFELAVRESAAQTIDLAGLPGLWPNIADADLWVWIDVNYAPNVATTANYIVSDADPRIGDPNAIIIGVIHLPAGSMTIDFAWMSRVYYLVASGGDRTWVAPTAREHIEDFVAGERPIGLFTGEDRYLLPSNDEKHALDGAATAATAANPYVTEADTTDKVWGEPTVVTVTVGAGLNYVDMAFAAYGAVYLGKGGVGTAQRYLDVRPVGEQGTWNWEAAAQNARRITITNICQAGGAVVINPAAATDAEGFYSGGIRVYFSVTYDAVNPTTCDVWYARKRTGFTLLQAPALALPNAFVERTGHADTTGAQRAWLPPGAPLNADATVTQALVNLRGKTRGPHGANLAENDFAADRFYAAYTYAQTYGDASEETLLTATWPRCMCYGYNDQGAIDGLSGGERFILYTVTVGGRDKIRRVVVADGETGGTTDIDPVTEVHNWTLGAGGNPCPGGTADWRIVALASDGRYVYIRLFENTSAVANRHVLACWDIVSRTQRWAAPVVIGEFADGTLAGVYDYEANNSMHICVASASRVAVNRTWEDLPAFHLLGQHNHGIAFYDTATGVFVNVGFGNACEAGWTLSDGYAVGPICSDGNNVYFAVRGFANGGAPFSANNYYEVAICSIANPTAIPGGSVNIATDLSGWNPNPGPPGLMQHPRSLVYDGKLVWMSTRFAITGWNTKPGVNELPFFGFDNTSFYIFGDMVFDGKHLYVGITDVNAALECTSLYHIVRFSPASIAIGSATGAVGTWEPLISLATGREVYPCVLDRNFMWACEAPLYFAGGFTFVDWSAEYPFGNMVFDGDTIWWTKTWWDAALAPPLPAGRCLTLQRLNNVRGV